MVVACHGGWTEPGVGDPLAGQLEGTFRVDGRSSLESPQWLKLSPNFPKSTFQVSR